MPSSGRYAVRTCTRYACMNQATSPYRKHRTVRYGTVRVTVSTVPYRYRTVSRRYRYRTVRYRTVRCKQTGLARMQLVYKETLFRGITGKEKMHMYLFLGLKALGDF